MAPLRVAIIGTGKQYGMAGATGFGMAHKHMRGYRRVGDARLVAVADVERENAELFVAEHEPAAQVYLDYRLMLETEKPEMASICTWPHLHCEMVVAAAEAGVRAIHCEKPMAPTFGEAKRMHKVCGERGVQLTFNHQRRFNSPFINAKAALAAGEIGELVRMEAQCPDLIDWGTHWFDMMLYFNDQTPVDWVMGQVETRGDHEVFGVHIEGQGISHFKFRNDVHATMFTGYERDESAAIRLIGTEGVIEIEPKGGVAVRMRTKEGRDWREIPTTDGIHGEEAHALAVVDAVENYRSGREPPLSSRHALQATELIFATYESSRRRGRVELPLLVEDSGYLGMLFGEKS